MTKLAHVEHERALGMLQANVTPLVAAKRFRCHVRTIGRLKNKDNVTPSASRASTCVDATSIEISRRPICAVDFIWSQSQLGHPKELIIQKSGLKLEKSFQEICLRPPPPSTIFQLCRYGSSWIEPVLS